MKVSITDSVAKIFCFTDSEIQMVKEMIANEIFSYTTYATQDISSGNNYNQNDYSEYITLDISSDEELAKNNGPFAPITVTAKYESPRFTADERSITINPSVVTMAMGHSSAAQIVSLFSADLYQYLKQCYYQRCEELKNIGVMNKNTILMGMQRNV